MMKKNIINLIFGIFVLFLILGFSFVFAETDPDDYGWNYEGTWITITHNNALTPPLFLFDNLPPVPIVDGLDSLRLDLYGISPLDKFVYDNPSTGEKSFYLVDGFEVTYASGLLGYSNGNMVIYDPDAKKYAIEHPSESTKKFTLDDRVEFSYTGSDYSGNDDEFTNDPLVQTQMDLTDIVAGTVSNFPAPTPMQKIMDGIKHDAESNVIGKTIGAAVILNTGIPYSTGCWTIKANLLKDKSFALNCKKGSWDLLVSGVERYPRNVAEDPILDDPTIIHDTTYELQFQVTKSF